MAAQRQRKRSYYGKLPSPRLFHGSAYALNPDQQPPGWEKLFPKKLWPRVVMDLRKQEQQAWRLAHEALFHHFGTMISTPGAWRNLALSLAHRHERELLVSGDCVCFSALCEKYGVDPADYECADQTLALKLAERYVWPELEPPSPKLADWGTRWSTEDLARLVWAILAAASVIKGSGHKGSDRALPPQSRTKKGSQKSYLRAPRPMCMQFSRATEIGRGEAGRCRARLGSVLFSSPRFSNRTSRPLP